MLEKVAIHRDVGPGEHPLTDVVEGLEASPALRDHLGEDEVAELLDEVTCEVVTRRGYMWVHGASGHLVVSRWHLRGAPKVVLHLDFVHELVHVVQWRDGRDLYDDAYDYVDRPTEIEAYRVTVEEARHLDLDEEFVREYLRVEWVDDRAYRRLLDNLGLEPGSPGP